MAPITRADIDSGRVLISAKTMVPVCDPTCPPTCCHLSLAVRRFAAGVARTDDRRFSFQGIPKPVRARMTYSCCSKLSCTYGSSASRRNSRPPQFSQTEIGLDGSSDAKKKRPPKHPHHGAGPIIIVKACEFSIIRAKRAKLLKAEGFFGVILVNSNPPGHHDDRKPRTASTSSPSIIGATIERHHRERTAHCGSVCRPWAAIPRLNIERRSPVAPKRSRAIQQRRKICPRSAPSIMAEDRRLFRSPSGRAWRTRPRNDPSRIAHTWKRLVRAVEIGFSPQCPAVVHLGAAGGGNRVQTARVPRPSSRAASIRPGPTSVARRVGAGCKYTRWGGGDRNDNCTSLSVPSRNSTPGSAHGRLITVAPAQNVDRPRVTQRLRNAVDPPFCARSA